MPTVRQRPARAGIGTEVTATDAQAVTDDDNEDDAEDGERLPKLSAVCTARLAHHALHARLAVDGDEAHPHTTLTLWTDRRPLSLVPIP